MVSKFEVHSTEDNGGPFKNLAKIRRLGLFEEWLITMAIIYLCVHIHVDLCMHLKLEYQSCLSPVVIRNFAEHSPCVDKIKQKTKPNNSHKGRQL